MSKVLTMFIRQFDGSVQNKIGKDLKRELLKLDIDNDEFIKSYENGMSGRLCDLSDIIDIDKYL